MPLYNEVTKEETIVTTLFDRAYRVIIEYPNKGVPSIRFEEERIERKNGIDKSLGRLGYVEEQVTTDNLSEEFNIINQEGDVLGTSTYLDVQALLYSLYFHIASKRDNT